MAGPWLAVVSSSVRFVLEVGSSSTAAPFIQLEAEAGPLEYEHWPTQPWARSPIKKKQPPKVCLGGHPPSKPCSEIIPGLPFTAYSLRGALSPQREPNSAGVVPPGSWTFGTPRTADGQAFGSKVTCHRRSHPPVFPPLLLPSCASVSCACLPLNPLHGTKVCAWLCSVRLRCSAEVDMSQLAARRSLDPKVVSSFLTFHRPTELCLTM